ncbi:MAG: hypothetical protein OEV85_14790, partial [Candidatus Thorarchaeota archaeon]|nr:hypothetical protein [Candidatus Thorarchaeota archaeon]
FTKSESSGFVILLSSNHKYDPSVAIGFLPAQQYLWGMLLIYTSCLRELFDERLASEAPRER